MKTQGQGGRKPFTVPPSILTDLWRSLARDLSVETHPLVCQAETLLAAGDICGFLDLSGTWTQQEYGTALEHRAWYQMASLFKKYPFAVDTIDPEAAALKKFYKAEHTCRRVNQKFIARRKCGRTLPSEAWLHHARRFIQSVIGSAPAYDRIWERCDFGPGASVGVKGKATHTAAKLECETWTVTPTAMPFACAALSCNAQIWELLMGVPFCLDYGLFEAAVQEKSEYTRANKIVCVPKTAKVHRTIAVEPLLNGYVQKGVDLYLRDKLRRVGIDLSDQTRNQEMARLGSLAGVNPFSTIDLSSASDSIAKELVRELLPPDWFDFLNAIRSPDFVQDGKQYRYEKFASMGNGFCFPLETLIFASIVHSVYAETGDTEYCVYGDDIIVRQSAALLVIERLKYCGFSTNIEKTFVHGPFKESCGADFHGGVNVRPYYVDEIPVFWDDIYKWMNGLRRITGEGYAWNYLLSVIPLRWRLLRPVDGPDDAITTELDAFMASRNAVWNRWEQRWSWRRLLRRPIFDGRAYNPASQMYGLLRGAPSRRYRVGYTFRRMTETHVALT